MGLKTDNLFISAVLALAFLLFITPQLSAESINLKSEINRTYDPQKDSLFDIFVIIPQNYAKVLPGSEMLVNVKLVNLGSGGRVDVILDYKITSANGSELIAKKETVAVETQANFVRTFNLPKDAPLGKYTVYAKLIYSDGKEAAAESSFEIGKSAEQRTNSYLLYGAIAAIALTLIIFLGAKSRILLERIRMRLQIHKIVKNKLG